MTVTLPQPHAQTGGRYGATRSTRIDAARSRLGAPSSQGVSRRVSVSEAATTAWLAMAACLASHGEAQLPLQKKAALRSRTPARPSWYAFAYVPKEKEERFRNAPGPTRTGTPLWAQALNLPCMPIPPRGHCDRIIPLLCCLSITDPLLGAFHTGGERGQREYANGAAAPGTDTRISRRGAHDSRIRGAPAHSFIRDGRAPNVKRTHDCHALCRTVRAARCGPHRADILALRAKGVKSSGRLGVGEVMLQSGLPPGS